jgi:hypothetical protein
VKVMELLSRNEKQILNALSLIILLVSLSNDVSLDEKLSLVLELLDFSCSGELKIEALTIMLMCLSTSYAALLSRKSPCAADVSKLAVRISQEAGGLSHPQISVWIKTHVLKRSSTSIEYILDFIVRPDLMLKGDRGVKSDGAKLKSKEYRYCIWLYIYYHHHKK